MQLYSTLVRKGYKDNKRYSAHITPLPTGKFMVSISVDERNAIPITKEMDSRKEAETEIKKAWLELGISTEK